ncbi:MAG: hypothetical protein KC486_28160 [Myxococcales bacterium]|nr:hypothetical protein [Myxococcales bacterium]
MFARVTSLLRSTALALAAAAPLVVGGCAGDDSSGDATASTGSATATSAATDGEADQKLALCESRCGVEPPAEVCGAVPSGCVDECVALGSAACISCRFGEGQGWQGMMPCGFTPCAFTDKASYDACAASCDVEGASCDFVLGGGVEADCADVCAGG